MFAIVRALSVRLNPDCCRQRSYPTNYARILVQALKKEQDKERKIYHRIKTIKINHKII